MAQTTGLQTDQDLARTRARDRAVLNASTITVAVSDTTVRLTGTVHSFEERREAERAAWNSPHATAVENNLTVVPR